jgi:hypothetical protein
VSHQKIGRKFLILKSADDYQLTIFIQMDKPMTQIYKLSSLIPFNQYQDHYLEPKAPLFFRSTTVDR